MPCKRKACRTNRQFDANRIADLHALVEQANRRMSTQALQHKQEMDDLRKRLQDRELDYKSTIARASAELVMSLARIVSPGTF